MILKIRRLSFFAALTLVCTQAQAFHTSSSARSASSPKSEIDLSPRSECGKRVSQMQQKILKGLTESYNNFKYLDLTRGPIDLRKWRVTNRYKAFTEKYLTNTNPDSLCKNEDLYREHITDAITGAGRQPKPEGFLIEMQRDLNNLVAYLDYNKPHMRLEESQFEGLLISSFRDGYADLKTEIETQKKLFHKKNDP